MKKRIVALLMALSLLASVCVFTANADNPGVTVNSAAELKAALETENAQITLGSDIVFNEGYTFAYDEENAVITVSDENGTVAKISTGEAEGSTPGAVIEGSLDALTTWAPLVNLKGADIDGAGFAIKGLFVNGAGFTNRIEMDESVKNLKFENTLVISNGLTRTGTLAGIVIGDVYDVEFKNSYVIANEVQNNWIVGGAIGATSAKVSGTVTQYVPTLDGISFDGAVFASGVNNVTAGGAVAQNKGGTIMNCENHGTVKVVGGTAYAVGGVLGILEPVTGQGSHGANGAPRHAYLYNLANYGEVVSNRANATIAGGVIGKVDITWSAGEDVIIRNFYNAGKVTNGKELIGSVTGVDGTATIGETKMEYGFAPLNATGDLCTTTALFAPLSIVKENNAKVLAYLNHGATSVEGLKTWKNDGGVLKMTDTDATYDSSFVAKDITTDTSFEGLTIISAEVINEKEIKLVFSEEVKFVGSVFAGIRYCNAGGDLAHDDSTPLQYSTDLRGNGSNTVIAKLPDSETKSMADIVSFKGYEDKNYSLMFCIEGLPNDGKFETRVSGEIEEIRGVYSGKNLKATEEKADGVYDDCYIDLTGAENASVAFTANTALPTPEASVMDVNPAPSVSLDPINDGVKILSAKVISETQIEITFSEAVNTNGKTPFIGIRYTNDALGMICEGEGESKKTLQFTGSLTLDGTTKGIFNYNPESNGGKTLYDVLSRKGYENSQYSVYLCIEGLPITDIAEADHVAGYIDNVKAVSGDKYLTINVADENPAYEDYYVPVTGGENAKPAPVAPMGPDYTTPDDGVKIESVKVIDEETMEITFSEEIQKIGSFFHAIRYTNIDLSVRTDPDLGDDPHLQFYGSITLEGKKATFKYKADDPRNHGLTFYEVLTMKGYEDKGYFLTYCIEGLEDAELIPSPVVGYVDNIISATDPTKLLGANKPNNGAISDGCYAPIEDIENAKPNEGGEDDEEDVPSVEVSTYKELATALASKSNVTIKVTADIVANEGVTYKYDEATGKVVVRNAENAVVAEYGTGKMETVAGELISGSIESLTKWTALTISNGNTVDFQGHKVSGFVLDSALFTEIDKTATLKNINVENVFSYTNGVASAKIGILAANNYGVIDTANITDAVILASNSRSANIGMAIGFMQSAKSAGKETFNPTANNIRTNGIIIYNAVEGNPRLGGLVGRIQGGKIVNSVNSADIIQTGTASYGTGGLVGLVEFDAGVINAGDNLASKTVTNIYIINCANYGKIDVVSGMYAAGLVGYADLIWSVSSTFTMNNCYNGGELINCKSSFIARSQGPTANGGGTVSCNYLFAVSGLNNPHNPPAGIFACEVIATGVQEYALECFNSNVGRLTAINGDENIFAWAWVEDGDIIVPDKEADIPEAGPVPPPPPIDPAEPNFTTTEGGVKIESVKALDHETLEVTFSEKVVSNGSFFIALRYVDANFTLMRDPSLSDPNLQFYGKSFTLNGNKGIFVFDSTKNNEKTLYDILTYKGYENLGYLVTFCIEGLANDELISNPVVGYVDNIVSAKDPTKLLAANKIATGGVFDACFAPIEDVENAIPPQAGENMQEPTVDMTPTEGGITVLSAKVINETQIEITFSEPVVKVGSVFAGIRYTNSSLKLMQDLILEDPNLQFYAPLEFDETDKTKAIYTYTPTDNRTLYDILDRRGYESKNYFVYFCIEGLQSESIPEPKVGYIDNIQSLDGTKLLASNKPSSAAGVYDGYYIPIENGDVAKPANHQIKPWYDINVLSAKLLNEREIEITFDKGALSAGSVFAGIRYVDNNNNLIWIEGQPLQFTGGLRINGTEKGIFTLSATANTLTMEEILAFKGYENKGYKVKLCFEGLPADSVKSPLYGYIDNVQTYDGRGMLVANKPAAKKVYDGLYLDIEDQENCTIEFTEATPLPTPDIPLLPIEPEILEVPSNSIKILEARVINSTQMKIVFSEAVQRVGSTFNAIRYVDRNLNLKYENGQALQWWSNTIVVDGNTITFSWENTTVSMKDVIMKKGFESSGYYAMFCFEGFPANSVKSPKTGYVDNITSKNGKKLLGANKPSAGGVYDSVYVNITGLENLSKPGPRPGWVDVKNRPYLTLVSAKVINPSQIELIFSEPIKTQGSMFTAIRYTDKDYNVQRDESLKDPYLQFAGSLTVDGTERAIWTLGGSSSKTLHELLNMKGYEKKGYYVYFCIEGLATAAPTKEPGYIDNIASLDGKKLLQCTRSKATAGGVYDGLYIKIQDVERALPIEVPELEGIFVDQIELVTPYKLELVFSEPIYIVGMGDATTQFQALKASIRYVDPNTYATITYNDRIMQFAADFYIEDGETIGTFEIRDQDTTVIDIFNMVGYEDLKEKAIPVLCLEGTADMSVLPTPYPGYVDNIQNQDGTNMLTAMIPHSGGVADVWLATANEIKLEVRKTEFELLKELVATDKMTSAELEAFAAMDEATLKETLTKAKELLDALKSGEMTETGVAAFNELLAKNGIDNAEKVKAMMFTVGETYNVGLPMLINLDVSEREYDWSDTVYVYRVNADGSIVEIAQRNLTVYVADEIITRIEFADSVLGDYFVTNSHLELPTPFNPAIIAYIAIGVIVLALIVLVICLASKKKKEKNA